MANNIVCMESVFVSDEIIFENFWTDLQIAFKLDESAAFSLSFLLMYLLIYLKFGRITFFLILRAGLLRLLGKKYIYRPVNCEEFYFSFKNNGFHGIESSLECIKGKTIFKGHE